MKFQIASDIHLDQLTFYNPYTYIVPSADILILAGDICHACTMHKHKKFFSHINESFDKILFIAGNHEFYNDNQIPMDESEKNIKNFLKDFPNIIYLNNNFIKLDNFLLAGSTFWFKPEQLTSWFRIPNLNEKDVSNMNDVSIDFLKSMKEYKRAEETLVFITHYPKLRYKKSSDLDDVSCDVDPFDNHELPSIWISGHTHKNKIQEIGETIFISNQRKGINYSNSFVLTIE